MKVESFWDPKPFWDTLPQPIIALSPMDGVTDHPCRHIQKKYGNPMLIYTEFTSVESLCQGDIRRMRDFVYDETQRPIIAQIFGYTPSYFRQIAILLCELGFDGIDVNMGCPSKNVAHTGAGAGLIKAPMLAQEIVRATQMGVQQWQNGATLHDCPDVPPNIAVEVTTRRRQLPPAYQQPRDIPVSVKTRIGYETPIVDEWIPSLLEVEPVAIGIHGRTLEQRYKGLADWDEIGRAVELAQGSESLILGNGDVSSLRDAHQRVADYGVDGVLIGRASFGNPFIFQGAEAAPSHETLAPTAVQTVFNITLEHARLYERSFSHYERYHFHPMRKHLGWYAKQIFRARRLRVKLVQTDSADDVANLLQAHAPLPLASDNALDSIAR